MPEPEPDADAIAAAALGCPGVVGLHGGPLNEFAAYLPGRTVSGVRIGEDRVEVHVVARYGTVLPTLAEQVRTAVTAASGGLPVEVHIDDLEVDLGPGEPAAAAAPDPVGGRAGA